MGLWDNITKAAGDLAQASKKYSLSAFTPDKRFAACCVKGTALITAADGEVEQAEVETSFALIKGEPRIIDYIGEPEAQALFEVTLAEIMEAPAALKTVKFTKIVSDIAANCPDKDKAEMIAVCEALAASDGEVHPDEQKIIDQLKKAMGVS